MKFAQPLVKGTLIRRHSRFLADVKLSNGEELTAHTSNTGAMLGCKEPGSIVWLSLSDNPKRKYPYTWEIIEVPGEGGSISVGINTMLSNKLVAEAIEADTITELLKYDTIKSEVKYGKENSRIDLLLENTNRSPNLSSRCYVEVKNVTLMRERVAYFPDAVSARGTKHLRELSEVVKLGERAVIFFCIQRWDAESFRPAVDIDPEYSHWLEKAVKIGVEAIAYKAEVTNQSIVLKTSVPVIL